MEQTTDIVLTLINLQSYKHTHLTCPIGNTQMFLYYSDNLALRMGIDFHLNYLRDYHNYLLASSFTRVMFGS